MKTKIMEFFTESAKVFTNPDDLFYIKTEGSDKNGIISLLFYSLMLGLVIGIATGDIVLTGILLVVFLIIPLLCKLIHSIFTFIFARILGGSGSFFNTFNVSLITCKSSTLSGTIYFFDNFGLDKIAK